ncbi:hypothetical protein BH09ACT10_BH09ACT10_03470 [soil metagenome]
MIQAGWPKRIGALFVDWVVAVLSLSAFTGKPPFGADAPNSWLPLVTFFIEVTLELALVSTTIGKRLFGVRVVARDGGPVGLARAAIRTALLCLVIPPLVNTDQQRGLHDLAAGTMAVKAQRKS